MGVVNNEWCLGGSRYGNFASWLIGALWILPPQRMYLSLSKKRRNCLTRGKRLVVEGEDDRLDILSIHLLTIL